LFVHIELARVGDIGGGFLCSLISVMNTVPSAEVNARAISNPIPDAAAVISPARWSPGRTLGKKQAILDNQFEFVRKIDLMTPYLIAHTISNVHINPFVDSVVTTTGTISAGLS
jgi:hypothetical protein